MAAALRAERLGRQIDISPRVSPSLSEAHRKSCERMKKRCATLLDELQGILVEDYPQAFGPGAKDRAGAQAGVSSVAPQSGDDEGTGGNTAASADTSHPPEEAKKKSKRVDLSDFDGMCSCLAVSVGLARR